MRVLVTGADGFIGRYTLPLLVKAGYEVHALCWLRTHEETDGVIWHKINLMDFSEVDALLQKLQVSHLLHLAWYTEHGKFWHADENLQWVACSLNLLQRFVGHGGERAVMAGSCAEYDWSAGLCSELETACHPATLYGTSKHALYQVAESYCAQHDVDFAWGRIFFLYGPGEVGNRFVPAVINGLLRQEAVACSDGSQIRDFMHVADVASAFVALLESRLIGAVNIASGESNTLRRIGEEIMSQISGDGYVDFGALPNRKDDPAVLTADVSRLRDELGWLPAYPLHQGLADTIDWWKQAQEELNGC